MTVVVCSTLNPNGKIIRPHDDDDDDGERDGLG